jgi:3-deoxy-D-manno-octulosonic-acid transferase
MNASAPLLALYRGLTWAATPASGPFLAWRRARGKEDQNRSHERQGLTGQPRPRGHLAWLHGASVGEGLALLPLVEQLIRCGAKVVLTTGTTASAQILQQRLPPGSLHQYAPLDSPRFMARFLNHWQPNLTILAESELWPNLIIETSRRHIPLLIVNARLSQRSLRRWRLVPGLAAALLGRIDLCLAQSPDDGARFVDLGAPHVLVTGNMKFDTAPPPANPAGVAKLTGTIGPRPVWVAASTHPGEEDIVASVHSRLRAQFPGLLTIIVPRHAHRGSTIEAGLAAQGFTIARRAAGAELTGQTEIYIADTMGEIGLFYRVSRLVFMGKSLVSGGGQNPIEPAKLGCAILHGGLTANFADIYALLDRAKGAALTVDADSLAVTLARLLADGGKLRAMARAAAETVQAQAGATLRIMHAIEPYIVQLKMERRQ